MPIEEVSRSILEVSSAENPQIAVRNFSQQQDDSGSNSLVAFKDEDEEETGGVNDRLEFENNEKPMAKT